MEIIKDLRQRHVEAWSQAYRDQFTGTIAAHHGANCRAAIDAGILQGVSHEEVGNMYAGEVAELSEQISELIIKANEPPKKKQS